MIRNSAKIKPEVEFMKRIVLTGGGTAGHVTPNLALLPQLRAEGWEVLYIEIGRASCRERVCRYV